MNAFDMVLDPTVPLSTINVGKHQFLFVCMCVHVTRTSVDQGMLSEQRIQIMGEGG